jgi:rod shape-determining protein MreC
LKNLFRFLTKNAHWLLFIGLLALSSWLLVHYNDFQRSRFMSASQEITGRVYAVSGAIDSYIGLKNENTALMQRIALLEQEILQYRSRIENLQEYIQINDSARYHPSQWRYITARILYNQVLLTKNYLILNKGSNDGVKAGMGVISSEGTVVGQVMRGGVSPHFSRVIPLLNPDSKPSCKILSSDFRGILVWDGKDSRYSYLNDLPGHTIFNTGDTIVTTGASAIFPEGVPIGVVADSFNNKNNGYNSLKIKLFTDFNTLKEVFIVEYNLKDEQEALEQGNYGEGGTE